MNLKIPDSKKIAGLLAKVHMPKVSEGREGALVEMTRKAIETLKQKQKRICSDG